MPDQPDDPQPPACPACTVQPYDPDLGEHHAHVADYGYVLYDPAHRQDLMGGLVALGRRQATEGWDRDEEWAISYTLNGDPCEPEHGGHVFDSREQAERHLDAWRRHYPNLTYADELYHRREVLTGPWEPAEQTQPCPRIAHESGVVLACMLDHRSEPPHWASRHANPAHHATWSDDDDRVITEQTQDLPPLPEHPAIREGQFQREVLGMWPAEQTQDGAR